MILLSPLVSSLSPPWYWQMQWPQWWAFKWLFIVLNSIFYGSQLTLKIELGSEQLELQVYLSLMTIASFRALYVSK